MIVTESYVSERTLATGKGGDAAGGASKKKRGGPRRRAPRAANGEANSAPTDGA